MAELIPTLNSCSEKMTPGERRFAKRIEASLGNDCLCWYDIPVGRQRRYPDFNILNPERGLPFLEVKDWRIEHLRKINKTSVQYFHNNELIILTNLIEQVRQCSYAVKVDIFNYVEMFYNAKRRHSACEDQAPAVYESAWFMRHRTV
ncbi:Uncharacterised protein [Yersinia wautersii]|uniref:VRR-NUC domain-containing protein n=1 Tax=Yersinia wautersii TaxID=1341643 RepID=A0ABP1ZHA0_9GAMM|nr:Uncharacterised protein [Yersinia wautersii]